MSSESHLNGLVVHQSSSVGAFQIFQAVRQVCKSKEILLNQNFYFYVKGECSNSWPGIYLKDVGGVRVEDVVYVTKNGSLI